MNIIRKLALAIIFLGSCCLSHAITNSMIAVSGTNVVLYWPSYGYETYLVQYRQTLDSTDSWSELTNAYPANSTNNTTLTISPNLPTGVLITGTNGGGSIDPNDTNTYTFNGTNTLQPGTGFFRVYHIPDWLVTFSGYAFDGPTFIPVDYSTPDAPVDSVETSTVLINGQPTDETTLIPYVINGVTNWGIGIYFDRIPNGTNTIQLLTTVRQSDTLNDQTPYMVFSNAPAAITVSNFVTYTDWSDLILSNSYTFTAQSSATNVNWEIDIYDVYGDFVNSQTGYSSDGNISWTWDLTDYNGDSRANGDNDPFFYPYINITDASGDPGGYMPPIAAQFPSTGSWLFSYLDNDYDDGSTNYIGSDYYYTNGIHNMEGGPIEWGIGTWDYPIKFGRIYAQTNRDASWQTMEQNYLERWTIRNFYYYGHGSPNSIGGDQNKVDGSNYITASVILPGGHAYLTSQWVHDNVTVNKSYGAIPFRFVFLDGCDTAAGNWPWAWGVPKQAESLSYYQGADNKSGARPSAFVGWDVEVGGQGWGTVDKFWQFRQDWMAEWAGTFQEQLNDALDTANLVSGWIDSGHYSHLQKYGFTTMMFSQYNHSGDWP